MNTPYKVGLIQMACSDDAAKNLAHAIEMIDEAASQGAQMVCLPELFRSRYFCQQEDAKLFDLAESIPGPTTEALGAVAKRHGIHIVASIFERQTAGLYYNSTVILDPKGEQIGHYRKMHIPDDPNYYEKFYFTPGDLGFRSFNTELGPVGTLICWDQWYPEAARLVALQGAQVIFYPTAIGWLPQDKEEYGTAQREAWQTIQRSHAIANGIYIAAVNRVGTEHALDGSGRIEFWGSSFICDPQGVVIAEAPTDQEGIVIAEVDGAQVEDFRRGWPFLRDRRIDEYHDITKRYIPTEDNKGN